MSIRTLNFNNAVIPKVIFFQNLQRKLINKVKIIKKRSLSYSFIAPIKSLTNISQNSNRKIQPKIKLYRVLSSKKTI